MTHRALTRTRTAGYGRLHGWIGCPIFGELRPDPLASWPPALPAALVKNPMAPHSPVHHHLYLPADVLALLDILAGEEGHPEPWREGNAAWLAAILRRMTLTGTLTAARLGGFRAIAASLRPAPVTRRP